MSNIFKFGPVTISASFIDLSFMAAQEPMRIDVKRLIYEKGVCLSDIAREVGVSPALVGRVVRGETCSRRVAECIASFLGLPLEALWPDHYPANARRRSKDEAIHRLNEIARNYHQEAA